MARYRSPTVFEYVDEECYDLSVGGMFIKSPAPAPTGTLLKLECDVRGEDTTIRGVARVVWIREGDTAEGPSGMGVKFVKLDEDGHAVIESIVATVGDAGLNLEEEALRGTGVSAPPPEAAIASSHPDARSSAPPDSPMDQPGAQPSDQPSDQPSHEPSHEPSGEPVREPAVEPQPERTAADTGAETPADSNEPPPAVPETGQSPHPEQHADPGQLSAPLPSTAPPAQVAAAAGVSSSASAPTTTGERARPGSGEHPVAEPREQEAAESGGRGWLVGVAVAVALVALIAVRSGGPSEDPPQTAAPTARPGDQAAHTQAPAAGASVQRAGDRADPQPRAAQEPGQEGQAPPEAGTTRTEQGAQPGGAEGTTEEPPGGKPPQGQEEATGQQGAQPATAEPHGDEGDAKEGTTGEAEADEAKVAVEGHKYVLEIVTTPKGATVVAGDKKVVAPGKLELGSLSGPMRVEARKEGHKPTAATVDPSMFEEEGGKMLKRIYLSLKPEK